jgi:hypothetical protein
MPDTKHYPTDGLAEDDARTVELFQMLERQGLVRIEVTEDWDAEWEDEWGERPEDQCAAYVVAEFEQTDGTWGTADGIGGCWNYKDPADPRENVYVPDMMREALSQLARRPRGVFGHGQ